MLFYYLLAREEIMDHYKLTIYQSNSCYSLTKQPQLTWIELQDTIRQTSHIFSFIPGPRNSVFGGCGFLRKKNCIPEDVQLAAHISLTKIAYTEMVQEGNCLHDRFLFYDDGKDPPVTHYN